MRWIMGFLVLIGISFSFWCGLSKFPDPARVEYMGVGFGFGSALLWGLSVVDRVLTRLFNLIAAVFAAFALGYSTDMAGLIRAIAG